MTSCLPQGEIPRHPLWNPHTISFYVFPCSAVTLTSLFCLLFSFPSPPFHIVFSFSVSGISPFSTFLVLPEFSSWLLHLSVATAHSTLFRLPGKGRPTLCFYDCRWHLSFFSQHLCFVLSYLCVYSLWGKKVTGTLCPHALHPCSQFEWAVFEVLFQFFFCVHLFLKYNNPQSPWSKQKKKFKEKSVNISI